MPEARLGWRGLLCLLVLSALTLGPGLGTATRLTYHEAFVAQGAREVLASGNWWHPTIGGLPWLEKPPLPFWLAAAVGRLAGGVSPLAARLPSAIAAAGLALGVALLAARRYGGAIGLLSGAIQATTAWTVMRGRLAEADILLACLVAWALLAFDRLRAPAPSRDEPPGWKAWRWAFFGLLGTGALVKGTGFGAVLVLSVVVAVLLWDRDRATLRRLRFPAGWILRRGPGAGLAAGDDRHARPEGRRPLDDARGPASRPPAGPWPVRRRELARIRAGRAGAGPPVDPAGGPRRLDVAGPGLPLAGPSRRADLERLRQSSRRRPPALGVVDRAPGPGVAWRAPATPITRSTRWSPGRSGLRWAWRGWGRGCWPAAGRRRGSGGGPSPASRPWGWPTAWGS